MGKIPVQCGPGRFVVTHHPWKKITTTRPTRSAQHLEEEDVGALHAGVEDLGGGQLIGLVATHDLRAADDALDVVLAGNVHDQGPVLVRALVDLLCCMWGLGF